MHLDTCSDYLFNDIAITCSMISVLKFTSLLKHINDILSWHGCHGWTPELKGKKTGGKTSHVYVLKMKTVSRTHQASELAEEKIVEPRVVLSKT